MEALLAGALPVDFGFPSLQANLSIASSVFLTDTPPADTGPTICRRWYGRGGFLLLKQTVLGCSFRWVLLVP